MKKQITYISPAQTAKALVLIYLTFSIPLVLLAFLAAFVRYGDLPAVSVVTALVLNAIIGFVLLWIACHAYNWLAERFGGIEVMLTDVYDEED